MHTFELLAILLVAFWNGAIGRQSFTGKGTDFSGSLTRYDTGCYKGNSSQVFIDVEYRKRYFNLFTRQWKPGTFAEKNSIYSCWDAKYASFFDRITSKVSRTQMFASFNPVHMEAVQELQHLIEENVTQNPERTITFLEYLTKHRNDIHPQLFLQGLSGAQVTTKSILWDLPSPALPDIFPTKFFKRIYSALAEPSSRTNRHERNNSKCLRLNENWGKENGIENRLWYFREDVQLNLHHWRWHLYYPWSQSLSNPPIPRRGELFSFFHHDLMARYAAERLANGFKDYFVEGILPRDNLVITQGYDSNLKDGVSTNNWVNRPNKTVLNQKTLSASLYPILKEHQSWYDRVGNISKTGIVNTTTGEVMLIPDGINTVGELFEASTWSLNKFFYGRGGWHNQAHNLLGSVKVYSSQPDDAIGVLGDTSTSIRDIVFYRIHQAVDNMFRSYKNQRLLPYNLSKGEHPLILPRIKLNSISIQSENKERQPNMLGTFWKNRNLALDGGLDFNYSMNANAPTVDVCLKHLDHDEFVYKLELENQSWTEKNVLIRIFMAPRYTSRNQRWYFWKMSSLKEQFPLFFVMDSFPQKLRPGVNRITRNSTESTVTSPWWTGKEEMSAEISRGTMSEGECTCGYPHHLLLPKGTEKGMSFDLVAVVTDGRDYVGSEDDLCASSWVLCGRPMGTYPDQKPMGWPWDRRPNPVFARNSLESFMEKIPNMSGAIVVIRHDDRNPGEHW